MYLRVIFAPGEQPAAIGPGTHPKYPFLLHLSSNGQPRRMTE